MGPAGDHERVAIMAKKKKLPTSFPPHTRWAVWDTTVFIEGMGSLRFILVSNEAEVRKAGGGQNLMVVNQVAEEVQKQATPLLKRVVHGWLKERPHLKQYTTNDSMLLCRLKAIKAIHSSTPSVKLASCTAMAKALRRSAELAPVASAIKELKLKRPPLSATSPEMTPVQLAKATAFERLQPPGKRFLCRACVDTLRCTVAFLMAALGTEAMETDGVAQNNLHHHKWE
ncbi:hypothetical protein VOLCADRAFT_108041 [Volvox carteri f. nagariensis]|uniref:Uncharacterized protein n=1 Tax=Volvox carteri f. nagariensis TaxID=3068 RepID=D8UHX3_VOLCA|nr:uncharacterized protein VOLCADRAFT_108041 [Volvox carteri f. nagariensis]EFJ40713.1 hypothetical protein VOLCADRAFT_108041 [Volvox carteri f. nagariensis]|eukprot:XP_002958259.1 hypothetical protein VOLCADRAFT_108041 [Volvox carteri f. nagariensis]